MTHIDEESSYTVLSCGANFIVIHKVNLNLQCDLSQNKVGEQYFLTVVFIVLKKDVLVFESIDEHFTETVLSCNLKGVGQYSFMRK